MNVLVINAGSSSLKYQLMNIKDSQILAQGVCERIGSCKSFHKYNFRNEETVFDTPIANHDEAVAIVLKVLTSGPTRAIDSLCEIEAVGHRVVQGGKYFNQSVLIDKEVIDRIDELAELAPLHNRAALKGVYACLDRMPGVPLVAVFDTSFFQTLPPKAYMYPLPYELYEKHSIRKYGAHGTSHRYIAERASVVFGKSLSDLKLITCHLGNGCSVAAIDCGIAVDTSMGLTPLDGLMMGTRCGSIDPAIVLYIMEHENLTLTEVSDLLNKKSGLLGISGISNDLRSIHHASEQGDERSVLAYEMYSNSVKKYIGQYIAVMGGVDAIVLTAGVGENCEKMRHMIFSGLQPLGVILDDEKNRLHDFEREISAENSLVKIAVIPTNEEYMIARDTYDLVKRRG